jgi:hypothetical protein
MEENKLAECIHDNIDIFVTEENPRMGYTTVVEHTIILKPDAVGKQQKPYRLSPQKREILRYHLIGKSSFSLTGEMIPCSRRLSR